MKDKTHRQRIEDELFYCYDPMFEKKCKRDIIILLGIAFFILYSFIALIAGVFNILS